MRVRTRSRPSTAMDSGNPGVAFLPVSIKRKGMNASLGDSVLPSHHAFNSRSTCSWPKSCALSMRSTSPSHTARVSFFVLPLNKNSTPSPPAST